MFVRMPLVIMDFHERILSMTGYETFLKKIWAFLLNGGSTKTPKKLDCRDQMSPEILKVM